MRECKCLAFRRFLKQKICCKYFVNMFKVNGNIAIYLFFQLLNQQFDALNSETPNALANSKDFFFIMAPSIGICCLLLSINQLHIVLSTFSCSDNMFFFLRS